MAVLIPTTCSTNCSTNELAPSSIPAPASRHSALFFRARHNRLFTHSCTVVHSPTTPPPSSTSTPPSLPSPSRQHPPINSTLESTSTSRHRAYRTVAAYISKSSPLTPLSLNSPRRRSPPFSLVNAIAIQVYCSTSARPNPAAFPIHQILLRVTPSTAAPPSQISISFPRRLRLADSAAALPLPLKRLTYALSSPFPDLAPPDLDDTRLSAAPQDGAASTVSAPNRAHFAIGYCVVGAAAAAAHVAIRRVLERR
ncbi:hypothetical protein R3P38DRAFT_3280533 [Favolaschia claudopus]|uniref:Uncharacterized protein n=1 Tax=Favolaschia claudopus TaxID=2862362 RepID=A0AAW0AHG3_9AGAR